MAVEFAAMSQEMPKRKASRRSTNQSTSDMKKKHKKLCTQERVDQLFVEVCGP